MVLSKGEFLYLISIIAFGFLMLLLFFLIVMVLNVRIRKQKEIEKLNAILETQENERKRIAEDMHDEIGPMLSAIKLQINSFLSLQTKEDLESNIKETSGYLNVIIQNVRNVVRNLSPANLSNHGLVKSIEDFRNIIEKDGHIRFNFMNEGIGSRWKETAEINIYRMVNEMINNSLKHSNCNEINLALRMYEKEFLVLYTDNGSIQEANAVNSSGMGVKNISSRANMMNGKVSTYRDFTRGAFYFITFENRNILQST
jgi:signal transduction histidine kinase